MKILLTCCCPALQGHYTTTMKRTLLILALAFAGSVHARDYYCDDRDLERQLERIEEQQEEILQRQEQAESEADQARREAEKAAQNARIDKRWKADLDACRTEEQENIVMEGHRQEALARSEWELYILGAGPKPQSRADQQKVAEQAKQKEAQRLREQFAVEQQRTEEKARADTREQHRLEIAARATAIARADSRKFPTVKDYDQAYWGKK